MGNHTTVSSGDKSGLVILILFAIIFGTVGISIYSFYTESYVLPTVDVSTAYLLTKTVTPLKEMYEKNELILVEFDEIAYENITSPLFSKQGLNCLRGSQNNYLFTYNEASGKSEADKLVVAIVSKVKPGGIFTYVGETFKTYCYKFEKDLTNFNILNKPRTNPVVIEQSKFEGFPNSYSECMQNDEHNTQKEGLFGISKLGSSLLSCAYSVFNEDSFITSQEGYVVDNDKYDECVKKGGLQITYASDCSFIFYNPEYVFPKNFRECVGENKGGVTSSSLQNETMCTIRIYAHYNKDVAIELMNKCVAFGGNFVKSINITSSHCYIQFKKS